MSKERAAQLVDAGIWLRLSGDLEGAMRLFEQALRLDPDCRRAEELLAQESPTAAGLSEAAGSPAGAPRAPASSGSGAGLRATTPIAAPRSTSGVRAGTERGRVGSGPELSSWPGPAPARELSRHSPPPFGSAASPTPQRPAAARGTRPYGSEAPPLAERSPKARGTSGLRSPAGARTSGELQAPASAPPPSSRPGAHAMTPPPIAPVSDASRPPAVRRSRAPFARPPEPTEAPPTVAPPRAPTPPPSAVSLEGATVPSASSPSGPFVPAELRPVTIQLGGEEAVTDAPSIVDQLKNELEAMRRRPSAAALARQSPPAQAPATPPVRPPPPPAESSPSRVQWMTSELSSIQEPVPTPVHAWNWVSSPAPLGSAFAEPSPAPTPVVEVRSASAWDVRGEAPLRIDDEPETASALDFVTSDLHASVNLEAMKLEVASLLAGARDLMGLDDHSGAMELIAKARTLAPDDPEVERLRETSERTLLAMLESKLGRPDAVPRVLLKDDEIIWLNLDHRAGFVLAQIDGTVTFDDLFAVSGMSRLDTARILAQLVDEGVISRGESGAR